MSQKYNMFDIEKLYSNLARHGHNMFIVKKYHSNLKQYEIKNTNTASHSAAPVSVAVIEESIDKTVKHVITSFRDIIDIAAKEREMALRHWLVSDVHLVSFIDGQIELRQGDNASTSLAGELTEKLQNWTKNRWVIALSDEKGSPTVEKQLQMEAEQKLTLLKKNSLVRSVLETFPDASLSGIRNKTKTEKNK